MKPYEIVVSAVVMFFWMLLAGLSCLVAILLYPYAYFTGGRKQIAIVTMKAADIYWGILTSWVEKWGRWQFVFSGEPIPQHETAFVIANHRFMIDWLMIFCLAKRKGRLGTSKFFAKSSVKFIPGIGWGIYLLDYIFLARDWTKDAPSIHKTFETIKERKLPFWLVSHVEGTRLTPEKLQQSHDFAKKKDLPIWNNVLIPRSKGFISTVQGLSDTISAVYDFTIVYNDGKRAPNLADLALRRGGVVNIHTRRFAIESLPTKEEDLEKWLQERWAEKEQLIEHFNKNGKFPNVYGEPFVHLDMKLEQ